MSTSNLFIIFSRVFTVFVFMIASEAAYASGPMFEAPWRGYDTGVFPNGFAPSAFAVGDMDGDGDLDIVVGDTFYSGSGVTVLKNNGDKTFAAPIYYSVAYPEAVAEVAMSDIDSDGDLDVIATIRGTFDDQTLIRVWRNNGNGTLAASVSFPTGQGPVGLIAADVTGDGKADIVTANYGTTTISVLKHNGLSGASAGFLAPVHFNTNTKNEKIAAADLNGDGKLDLAVGGQDPSTYAVRLSIMMGDGIGNFGAPVAYDPAPGATYASTAVALADIDNDGDADLIGGGSYSTGSVDNGAVTIHRNNGSGVFVSPEIIQFDNFAPLPKEITTGDLNGDGVRDIIAAIPSGRAVEGFETILSNGSGGFQAPVYNEASQQTFDVLAADIDGDSDLDVFTLANSSAAVSVHENPGNGVFPKLTRYEVASSSDAVESADIDNDGDRDLVVNGEVDIASNDAVVKILRNNGNGTFSPAEDYFPPRNFADMKLRDINNDGFVDIIFAPDGNYPNYHIGTALNLGNGTFGPTVVFQIFSCGEGTIDAADLDGDGDRDIVLTEEEGCAGGAQNRIFVLRNDGNQNFTRMTDLVVPGLPHGLALADVTGDGKIDIISALSPGMGVYPGNGNLTFGSPIISSTTPYKFRMADFNQDGKLDLGEIMQQDSFGTDTLATSLGNGDGTFQSPRTQTGSSVLENLRISDDLEIADFDGDGRPDLCAINYASNDVSFLSSNPDGSLKPHQRYGIANTPHLATAGDFDGDGKPDLAAAVGLPPAGLHNAIVILRNLGGVAPTPTPSPALISGTVTYGNASGSPRSVPNVLVSGVGSVAVSTSTNSGGTYTLSGFGSGAYIVSPSKTDGQNGITSFDAARIAQHVAGINPLTGNALIVADTSGNGSISSFDAAQIARYAVALPPYGSAGTWIFSPASRNYASVGGSVTGEDYTALLMGEVSGNWTSAAARVASGRGPERNSYINAPTLAVKTGESMTIPLNIQGPMPAGVISYEFTLRYDPSVIAPLADPVGIERTASRGRFIAYNSAERGVLRVAVYGTAPMERAGILLNLKFTAVGKPSTASPLIWERFMLNESEVKHGVGHVLVL
jgi:hypothetical protein